jgi:hypothetical protein
MTGPPALRPVHTDPGGLQARADGQEVAVRSYEGELIRVVPFASARELVEAGLVDDLRHSLRLKLGIRWLPPHLDRASGRPDLEQMRRRDPGRYSALWRGTLDARAGKAALGRQVSDATVRIGPRPRFKE